MSAPIALEEAWRLLLAPIAALPGETVAIDDTVGRYLAEPPVARRTQPHADLSVMDGFACAGPGPWELVGESRAGAPFIGSLDGGQAVQISTGAVLPDGADTVLPVEDARVEGSHLLALSEPQPGAFIRRRGFDFSEGEQLLDRGTSIGPTALALARSAGIGELAVCRRPRVAIVECGDELVADPRSCPPDRLPASNGAMLAAMARHAGAEVERAGPVADDRPALAAALEPVLDRADLVVTSGGASVGEHDHVRPVLASLGATIDLWRVAIRPGKPLVVARRDAALMLGLPGNPASSFVTGFLFMLPAIRAMMGANTPLPSSMPIVLDGDLPGGSARREFRRARLVNGRAQPIAERDSSALRALASADLLIDRPANASPVAAGTPVPCYWLGNGGNA